MSRDAPSQLVEHLSHANGWWRDTAQRLLVQSGNEVQLQFVLTVGERNTPDCEEAVASVLLTEVHQPLVRDGAISGLYGRELQFLERLLKDRRWDSRAPGRSELLTSLASCIVKTPNRASRIERLLEIVVDRKSEWQQLAIIDGVAPSIPVDQPGAGAASVPNTAKIQLPARPVALAALAESPHAHVRAAAQRVAAAITWAGKPGFIARPAPAPLTPEQQKRFEHGRMLYGAVCAACHQPSGLGQEGLAPPLVDSRRVNGPPENLVRIVLHGLRGPIDVGGRRYEMEMPPLGAVLSDEQVAAVLTYVRREWDHHAGPIDPVTVKTIRALYGERSSPWTAAEIDQTAPK